MRQVGYPRIVGILAMAVLFAPGCASQSGSGGGADRMSQVERIGDQPIKGIDSAGSQSASEKNSSAPAEFTDRDGVGAADNSLRDVLFDFDSATIREDAISVLESNAKRLKQDSAIRIILEGRGDEVGTSAYNLVLGERRARNVKSYLEQLGLATDLNTTSYGKDRPLCSEHTTECMQKNRSVRFIVRK